MAHCIGLIWSIIGNNELRLICQRNPLFIIPQLKFFYLFCVLYICLLILIALCCNVSSIIKQKAEFYYAYVDRLFGSLKFHCTYKPHKCVYMYIGKWKILICPLSFDIQSPKLWRSQIQLLWHTYRHFYTYVQLNSKIEFRQFHISSIS